MHATHSANVPVLVGEGLLGYPGLHPAHIRSPAWPHTPTPDVHGSRAIALSVPSYLSAQIDAQDLHN
eukprot:4468437-Alexandrium_andersonii.AAC.1